jgi:hypothetical protein
MLADAVAASSASANPLPCLHRINPYVACTSALKAPSLSPKHSRKVGSLHVDKLVAVSRLHRSGPRKAN